MLSHFLQSPVLIWALGITMALCAGVGTLAINEVKRVLAKEEPHRWQRYGRPSGLFSSPRGSFSGSQFRFLRDPIVDSITRTPTWLAKHPRGTVALRVARLAFIGMFAAMALLVFAALWRA